MRSKEQKRAENRAYYLAHRDRYAAKTRAAVEARRADPELLKAWNARQCRYRAAKRAGLRKMWEERF